VLELRTVVLFLAGHLVVPVMFLHGLQLEPGTLRHELRRPVFWRAVAATVIAVPLVAVAVVKLLPVTPLAAGVITVMAICPGQVLLVRAVEMQRGHTRLALSLAVMLSLVSIVTVPAWVRILSALFPFQLEASAAGVFGRLLPQLLLPMAAGFVLRLGAPKLAKRLERPVEGLFLVALGCAAVLVVVVVGRQLGALRLLGLAAAVLAVLASALVGWTAGGPDPRDRRTVAIAAIFGNPAVALYVAQVSYPALPLTPAILAYVVVRALALLLFTAASRARLPAGPARPRGATPA
jgi:BASS family bile acid:Na+ symporter